MLRSNEVSATGPKAVEQGPFFLILLLCHACSFAGLFFGLGERPQLDSVWTG